MRCFETRCGIYASLIILIDFHIVLRFLFTNVVFPRLFSAAFSMCKLDLFFLSLFKLYPLKRLSISSVFYLGWQI